MKKVILVLCAALLLPFSCKKQELQAQEDVDAYVNSLLNGSYQAKVEMKLFEPEAIPALLKYADDRRQISCPPVNPLSSFMVPSCTVGMYMLWTIEGIRKANCERSGKEVFGYPSLIPMVGSATGLAPGEEESTETQSIVAKAYQNWWATGPFSLIKDKDPLDGTNLYWR